jgi:hypothetical protein
VFAIRSGPNGRQGTLSWMLTASSRPILLHRENHTFAMCQIRNLRKKPHCDTDNHLPSVDALRVSFRVKSEFTNRAVTVVGCILNCCNGDLPRKMGIRTETSISRVVVLPVLNSTQFECFLAIAPTQLLNLFKLQKLCFEGRGRDRSYERPPAQIRTGRITAYGSYLG